MRTNCLKRFASRLLGRFRRCRNGRSADHLQPLLDRGADAGWLRAHPRERRSAPRRDQPAATGGRPRQRNRNGPLAARAPRFEGGRSSPVIKSRAVWPEPTEACSALRRSIDGVSGRPPRPSSQRGCRRGEPGATRGSPAAARSMGLRSFAHAKRKRLRALRSSCSVSASASSPRSLASSRAVNTT
jgi:hypothetical protein